MKYQQSSDDAFDATAICNAFLGDCHDGTFRTLNDHCTLSNLLDGYKKNKQFLRVSSEYIITDTSKYSLGKDFIIDSIHYIFKTPLIPGKEHTTNQMGLNYFFQINGGGDQDKAQILADSIKMRLIKIYGASENADNFKYAQKMKADDSTFGLKEREEDQFNAYFIYGPEISFVILSRDGQLLLQVRFANWD